MSSSWVRPVIETVLLPAHAQTSTIGAGGVRPPALTGNIEITSILWRQTASTDPSVLVDEYVDIFNADNVAIDIGGWQLGDTGPNFTMTFPSRVIFPGESCRIYVHSAPGLQSCEFSFGRTSPGSAGNYIFNNTGDSATLTDAS
ncbi:MAG: lamin tail domain-containing protein, partial [bacterium]